ncbi:MAG TPA: methyltransferase [Hyphomicrobiaceae bacterium]|nr:methyltransferase [Hyphomicrobiaceae bacterium]
MPTEATSIAKPQRDAVAHVRDSARDKALSVRDRLLMSPRFQRWAARFPLTRPIARRQARQAFDLCAGFVYSQTLFAAIRLGLLDAVTPTSLALSELIARSGLPPDRAALLIDAAIGLDLLSRRSGDRIGLGMIGAAIAANPSIAAMVEHHDRLYADLSDPVALLGSARGDTKLSRFWPYSGAKLPKEVDPEAVAGYSALMTSSQQMLSADILDAYPFDRHRRVLDLGGGEGAFATEVVRRHATINACIFDLPAVAQRARDRIADAGLSNRIETCGGDFFDDALPGGFDAVTLVRIVHDHDDDRVLQLFRNIRRSLTEGGTLVIAEPMSDTLDATRVTDIYFAFYLLAMGSGRPRSPASLRRLLEQAGFTRFRTYPTARPMLVSILTAKV